MAVTGMASVLLMVVSLQVDVSARIDPPAGPDALAPHLSVVDTGIALTWLEPVAEDDRWRGRRPYRLRFSVLSDTSWTEPVTIVESDKFFANWADVPSCEQAADGTLIAHWLQKSGEGTYSYDVMLARSSDRGATWTPLGKLNDDDVETEHGFVSLVREGDGVRAFWLDGRDMTIGHGADAGHASGSMGLRTAMIRDHVGPSALLDDRVCECCGTSAAVTADGPVIFYRDRTSNEIRDVSVVRQRKSGWSDPVPVHVDEWEINGCPVNGPAAAARGDQVVVAWFTAADGFKVLTAYSSDGGRNFHPPLAVDEAEPIGRVAVGLMHTGDALICWYSATTVDQGSLLLRTVAPDGRMSDLTTVDAVSLSRKSGFPDIAIAGDQVLVVWTHVDEESDLRSLRARLIQPPQIDRVSQSSDDH